MFQRMKSSRSYLETSIFFVILLASLTLFLGIFIQDDWVSPSAKYCIDLDDDWTIVKPDGKEIEVDGEFSIGKDKPVTFYRILPENIQNDDILRIKCPYETVDAYCGGEHIYHAGEAKLLSIHTTVGNVFALIPLKKDYSGKKITITVKPRHYGYEVLIKDAAITTMSAYTLERLIQALPYIVLSFVLLIISIVSFAIAFLFKVSFSQLERSLTSGFLYLGMFGVCASSWILADFHITGMLIGRMAFSGLINYIGFMLCPFMFSGMLVYSFTTNRFFKAMFILSEVNFIVQMIFFLSGIHDLPDGLIVSQVLAVFLIIGLIHFGLTIIKNCSKNNVCPISMLAVIFIIFSISAVVAYVKNGKWLLMAAAALTFYAIAVITFLSMKLVSALKKNMELEHMTKMAYLDKLTGLKNRRAYEEYLSILRAKKDISGQTDDLTIVMLDVNGLKCTNDTLGHFAGDELIIKTADCIRSCFGMYGNCYRTGGDEFVVIARMSDEDYKISERTLRDKLAHFEGRYINGISISIGKVRQNEFSDKSLDEILDIADKRMYKNKRDYYSGNNNL